MPSLRRSVSESASTSRASPYPTSLSLSAAGALNAGVPVRPRRVASETSRRRPLADIEWWRIQDGQQEENDAGNENIPDRVAELQGDLAEAMQDASATAPGTAGAVAEMDSVDDPGAAIASPDARQGASSLTTPFAALSISSSVPITPPMTPPRSRNASSAYSGSSAASTPDSSPRTPALHRGMLFNMDALGCEFECAGSVDDDESGFCTPLPPFLTVRGSSALHGLAMMRSTSFGGFDFDIHREATDERFGDVIFV